MDIDRALGEDLWVVQETEQLQRTFTKMVGGLVNDSKDVWVKGPEKMSADFIHLINNDSSKTVYSALICTIKKRRYRYVSRVKKPRTSISRDKDYWRSPWGIYYGNLLSKFQDRIITKDFAVDFEFRTSGCI